MNSNSPHTGEVFCLSFWPIFVPSITCGIAIVTALIWFLEGGKFDFSELIALLIAVLVTPLIMGKLGANWCKKCTFSISPAGIRGSDFWQTSRFELEWSEIDSIREYWFLGCIRLVGAEKSKVMWVPTVIEDYARFLSLVATYTKPDSPFAQYASEKLKKYS